MRSNSARVRSQDIFAAEASWRGVVSLSKPCCVPGYLTAPATGHALQVRGCGDEFFAGPGLVEFAEQPAHLVFVARVAADRVFGGSVEKPASIEATVHVLVEQAQHLGVEVARGEAWGRAGDEALRG